MTTTRDLLNDDLQEVIKKHYPDVCESKYVKYAITNLLNELEENQDIYNELPVEAIDLVDKPFEVQKGEIL